MQPIQINAQREFCLGDPQTNLQSNQSQLEMVTVKEETKSSYWIKFENDDIN
jgi:hypothetical protein